MKPSMPRLAFGLLILAMASSAATADPRKLSGPEIKQLFSGKTAHGMWGSSEYWSYFSPDGWTTYKSKGPHQDGRWGANASQYCSKWPTSGESCYNIYQDGTAIIWEEPQSGHRYQSELLPGNQVPAD
jgi:hypothetical protein